MLLHVYLHLRRLTSLARYQVSHEYSLLLLQPLIIERAWDWCVDSSLHANWIGGDQETRFSVALSHMVVNRVVYQSNLFTVRVSIEHLR